MSSRRANGTGSVYKEGKTWTASWTNSLTKERFKKRGFASKKDATLYIESMRSQKAHSSIEYL